MVSYGTDINRLWAANPQGDLAIVTETDNAEQAVYNRLMTKLGELDWAEYENYGNRAYEAIGSTDTDMAKAKIKLYVEEALLQEPRISEIENIEVSMDDIHTANIEINAYLTDEETLLNLIITQEAI